jgi:hypothetical protein
VKKRWFVQNAQNIRLVDTVFEELASDESFIETCNTPSDMINKQGKGYKKNSQH